MPPDPLNFAGGERLGQAGNCGPAAAAGPRSRLAGACPQDGCEVAEGHLPGGGLPVPVDRSHRPEQGSYGRAFAGEHRT